MGYNSLQQCVGREELFFLKRESWMLMFLVEKLLVIETTSFDLLTLNWMLHLFLDKIVTWKTSNSFKIKKYKNHFSKIIEFTILQSPQDPNRVSIPPIEMKMFTIPHDILIAKTVEWLCDFSDILWTLCNTIDVFLWPKLTSAPDQQQQTKMPVHIVSWQQTRTMHRTHMYNWDTRRICTAESMDSNLALEFVELSFLVVVGSSNSCG